MTNKIHASIQNINDLSSTFKNLMDRYYGSLGSYRKVNKLSYNIKSYVLKNFTIKNSLIGDDPNDYLSEELNHIKKNYNPDLSILNDTNSTNDKQKVNYYKLHQSQIKNIRRGMVRNSRDSNESCSFINRNDLSFSHSKANNSLVIQTSSLLPILSTSRKGKSDKDNVNGNNNDSNENEFKKIQSKVQETIEKNIKKKRRLYDYQYDKLIENELNNPKSLKLFRIIKMKFPLNNIQNDITKIEDSINNNGKQVRININNFDKRKVFLDKRLMYLLSKYKKN